MHADAFKELKIMVELDLSHNNITEIAPKTFEGNERLQTLSLAHNQVCIRVCDIIIYEINFSMMPWK